MLCAIVAKLEATSSTHLFGVPSAPPSCSTTKAMASTWVATTLSRPVSTLSQYPLRVSTFWAVRSRCSQNLGTLTQSAVLAVALAHLVASLVLRRPLRFRRETRRATTARLEATFSAWNSLALPRPSPQSATCKTAFILSRIRRPLEATTTSRSSITAWTCRARPSSSVSTRSPRRPTCSSTAAPSRAPPPIWSPPSSRPTWRATAPSLRSRRRCRAELWATSSGSSRSNSWAGKILHPATPSSQEPRLALLRGPTSASLSALCMFAARRQTTCRSHCGTRKFSSRL
mmetsp:Transcript_29082/g.67453  ORF Transcript_29082/g.67453 Transcript_29082/m.67453 type:complete len:287 (-) Transcript_29082:378-1238(-)